MGKLQEFYDSRYKKGLCIYCGKNAYTLGKKTCEECRNKRKYGKKRTPADFTYNEESLYTTEKFNCEYYDE